MEAQPDLPIAISLVGNRLLIFDINAVTYLRRQHHICGVMGGTLPQNPSQNLFLGLPMQILPEEAQLLIDKGVGYLFDDPKGHDDAIRSFDSARYAHYMANVRRKALQASKIRFEIKEEQKRAALSKQKGKKAKSVAPPGEAVDSFELSTLNTNDLQATEQDDQSFNAAKLPLFTTHTNETNGPVELSNTNTTSTSKPPQTQAIITTEDLPSVTPTTSADFLPAHESPQSKSNPQRIRVPNLPPSYALYKHLNSRSYYMTPGLRFGCQYTVYPGDPLRFHSHFLAVNYEWDEEIDLMDVVGGGRLGTGVKKGWLIGGEQPATGAGASPAPDESNGADVTRLNAQSTDARMRTFSVEWAAM